MYPVDDVETAAACYLSLGFRDVARPDHDTVLLADNDSPYVDILLEQHPVESKAGSGPVFRIADVSEFHRENPSLRWMGPPVEIPPGKYGIFMDPAGNPVRVVDFTNDSGRYARLFRPAPSAS
ncbi:MAG TPA: hypothetical protein VE172_01860 [Stackebrandtia sp.]|uniref:VOC family protein n=1 Tax=Stackebrandtia sp. TaxID=2023065 RepID=UPI002D259561|nr:hypothetical protein [Stackebrandtia sp.]HZE37531.1 hypothetical protein [Stackebrandtia sp.]